MYILALAALLQMTTVQPQMVSAHATADECLAQASKLNHENPDLKSAKAQEMGIAYVCLKLVYPV